MPYIPTQEDIDNPCKVCGLVFDNILDMVECEKCSGWYHNKCVGNIKIKRGDTWICHRCTVNISVNTSMNRDSLLTVSTSTAGNSSTANVTTVYTGTTPKILSKEAQPATNSGNTFNSDERKELCELKEMFRIQQEQLSKLIKSNLDLKAGNNSAGVKKATRSKHNGKCKPSKNKKKDYSSSDDESDSASEQRGGRRYGKKNMSSGTSSDSDSSSEEEQEDDNAKSAKTQLYKYIAQQEVKELPTFDGSATQWPSFYRTYKESKKLFSDTANRNRLQKALTGKALKAVAGLLLSPTTVDEAVKMLKFRFGQPDKIIEEAIHHAMQAETPTERKPETIVDYAMLVLTINANINAIGDKTEKSNPMLIKSLAQRLPHGMQRRWNRRKRELQEKGKRLKVSTFSKWLLDASEDYIDLIETSAPEVSRRSGQKKPINFHQTQYDDEKKKDEGKRVCFKCSQPDHELMNCHDFQNLSCAERKEFVRRNELCLICLRRGHRWRRCFRRSKTGGRNFHELISDPEKKQERTVQPNRNADKKETTMTHYHDDEKPLFKIVPVIIYGPVSQLNTFALLDDCASVTLIDEEIAKKILLKGPVTPLTMSWTKDIVSREEQSMRVKFGISGVGLNHTRINIRNARTVKNLSLPAQNLDAYNLKEKYPYLQRAELVDLQSAVPTILIGLDNTNLIAPQETRIDPGEKGPVAIRTKLGWTVHGPESHHSDGNKFHPTFLICECQQQEEARIEEMVENYFSMENQGVEVSSKSLESTEDRVAKKLLSDTTKRQGDRFVTGLLWKSANNKMPNNYDMCMRRLLSIEHKMRKNPQFSKIYAEKIREYVQKGYARKLNEQEIAAIKDNMWLLPHFGTCTPNKPKLRLVFDAKATFAGVSLNSRLLTGPDQYNSLLGVLYKFRQGEFAVAADVREMFHQIQIRSEDQRFQCFLWRDGRQDIKPEIYAMNVMIFGSTCSPCSAQYVKNVNAREFEEGNSRAVVGIIERFYVDDYMDSFETEHEALAITRKVIEINKHGGFELRNVISNSKLVANSLSDSQCSIISMNIENEQPTEKVLGMFWDTASDEFLFKIKFILLNFSGSSCKVSKRELLRTMMSIFDPLGLIAHYLVRAKIILQEVWMRKVAEWDTILPEDICRQWSEWMTGLKRVEDMRIARNYSAKLLRSKNTQLHIFTDASERAYSAVAYFRMADAACAEIRLITGKTKIVSQKSSKILSMPRLELQGAILGTRLATTIIKEHSIPIESITFWTDSPTVLAWLNTEYGSFKSFVAHRIAEIHETTTAEQWRYVTSGENPADDATKTTKHDPFDAQSRWFSGPSFLKLNAECWPIQPAKKKASNGDPEVRRIFLVTIQQHERTKWKRDFSALDPNKFSDWLELKRTTAWVKRGIYNLQRKIQDKSPNLLSLSLSELHEAELYHIKKSQLEAYKDEVVALSSAKPVSIKSKIKDLLPYIDETGVMRMEGRIEATPNVSWRTKRPIILDRKHHVTRLIIQHYHQKFQHQFQESVVNEIRTQFWIPKLRIAVKDAKKKCQQCKNSNAMPRPPQMSKLPIARLGGPVGCFHYCGIDLFGPMLVPVKRSLEKRWGVVFTCLTTRAIYIDLVPDLSADSLILTIRNCNSRRGPIGHIYSDCGTNLKGAKNELRAALDDIGDEKVQKECVKRGIEWHFNPPASPHMGGCWERMVRSIKNVLKVLLKETHPKEHTLRSLMCEVEDIINLRPLTYIALEKDSDDALTPKHFLNPLLRTEPVPLGEFTDADVNSRKQWRIVQMLANHFWRRWVVEYLPMITRTTKWHEKTEPLKKGDVVIICDNEAPRNTWEKAIIIDVKQSLDGQVRSATVKTIHGILTRPAIKLAKLDVFKDAVNSEVFTKGGVNNDNLAIQ